MCNPLQSARLVLRRFESTDTTALEQVFGDAEVMRFGPGTQSLEWIASWIKSQDEHFVEHDSCLWAAVSRSSPDDLLGYCGLTFYPNVRGQPEFEIGYRLAKKFWGRGYATEAATLVRDFAFEHQKTDARRFDH